MTVVKYARDLQLYSLLIPSKIQSIANLEGLGDLSYYFETTPLPDDSDDKPKWKQDYDEVVCRSIFFFFCLTVSTHGVDQSPFVFFHLPSDEAAVKIGARSVAIKYTLLGFSTLCLCLSLTPSLNLTSIHSLQGDCRCVGRGR